MIKRPAQLLGTLVVLGCWGPIGASAADIVWTNTAGGRWSDAANWAPNQVPSIDDTALITQSGVYTVAVNASNAVGGLVVGGSGGTQTVDVSSMLRIEGAGNIAAAGRLILSGTLGGSALLQLSGGMTWSGGKIDTNAAVVVNPGGQLTVSSTFNYTKSLHGALTNAGAIRFLGNGNLLIGGILHNHGGGLFDIQTDSDIGLSGGPGRIVNEGVFRKSAGAGTTACAVPIENHGAVDVQVGILTLASGSILQDGSAFTGAGKTYLHSGIVTWNGGVTSENLVLEGAALDGAGILGGTAFWGAGSIATNGALTVATNGLLTIESKYVHHKYVHGALTNTGIIRFLGNGNLGIVGILHNQAGGLIDIQTDYGFGASGSMARIVNEGVLRKSAGSGTTACAVPIENHGTVDVQVGILTLAGESVLQDGSAFTGAGKTYLDSGIVALNGGVASENLVLDGAALSGAGILSGTAFWGSGSIATNGALTIATNGLLTIQSKYVHHKFVRGALTNAGTIRFLGSGNLEIDGILHNRAGGLIDIQTDYDIGASGSTARIVNDGVFRKSAGADRTVCAAPFSNHGVVDVQTGSLILSDGSLLSGGCAFTGLGTTRLESGTNRVDGVIHSENLVLDGATLVGTGNVTGSFAWSSGTIDAGLSFYVTPHALLTISSRYVISKYLNGYVTNAGTVNFLGNGSLILAGTFHNLAGALLDIQTDYDLVAQDPAATVVNEGIVRKTATAGMTAFRVPFYNAGVVEVGTGTLNFASNYHHSAAATISLAGGAMQTAGQVLLEGGLLTGWGAFKPGAGSNAALTSAATIAPAANGTLTVQGDFTQLITGTLELALDTPLAGAGPSRLAISGTATLGGAIGVKLADGYLPNPSDAFNGISFRSRVGDFHCFNGFLLLGHDLRFLTQYSATNLALVAVAMPDPADPTIRVAAENGSAIVCWPAEFVGCQLYWTTNIVAPVWTPLPDITHRYVESPMAAPRKFFCLGEP